MNTKTTFEYQCFYLDPTKKLAHADDAEPLHESNNLGECLVFVYNCYKSGGLPIAVYQPKHKCYREIYRKRAHDGQPRGEGGRFASRVTTP